MTDADAIKLARLFAKKEDQARYRQTEKGRASVQASEDRRSAKRRIATEAKGLTFAPPGFFDGRAVQQALRGCPTGSATGCTPINIFGAEGTLTPTMFNFINVPTFSFVSSKLTTVEGSISGDLGFSSPFSDDPVGVAARLWDASVATTRCAQLTVLLGAGGIGAVVRRLCR